MGKCQEKILSISNQTPAATKGPCDRPSRCDTVDLFVAPCEWQVPPPSGLPRQVEPVLLELPQVITCPLALREAELPATIHTRDGKIPRSFEGGALLLHTKKKGACACRGSKREEARFRRVRKLLIARRRWIRDAGPYRGGRELTSGSAGRQTP
jgi:hypothetical protein